MKIQPSTVVIALSGGVDSSLTAALLKEVGWKVTGLHFLLPASPSEKRSKRLLVQQVAEHLHIPIDFVDIEEEFDQKIVSPFTEDYLKGLTPNPCVMCNSVIKFDHLIRYADNHEIVYIATGHYAKLKKKEDGFMGLWRGKDKKKEQSYFLHRLNQSHLSRTLFPLARITKKETRHLANKMGLPTASVSESQEICFIPGNDYRMFIESKKGCGLIKGDIINRYGEKLGEHSGTYRFTIGQRHGLGIASSRPYYVMEIRPDKNQLVVGRKEELYATHVEADSFNWVKEASSEKYMKVMAQIRYRHKAASGLLEVLSHKRVRFEFDEPQWAITPGQALVCYEGDQVIGGGWIV